VPAVRARLAAYEFAACREPASLALDAADAAEPRAVVLSPDAPTEKNAPRVAGGILLIQ
jgi:hypothetical protein